MNFDIVAFDMDYTLLRTGGILSPKTKAVLEKAHKAGILLVPTTGRDICEMGTLQDKLFARYMVTVNGAVVRDEQTGQVIYKKVPPQEAFLEKLKLAISMGLYTEVYCDGVYATQYSYDNMANLGITADQLEMFSTTRKPVEDLYAYTKTKGNAEKLHIVFRDVDDKQKRQEVFLNHPDFAYTAAFVNNLELSAKGVDKATGLTALASHLGIDKSRIMAIGDGSNDACMLSWAGLGVAVANAVPEAKAAADVLTLSNDEDGAAEAILRYCF